jgi:hypothetical protein
MTVEKAEMTDLLRLKMTKIGGKWQVSSEWTLKRKLYKNSDWKLNCY